MAKSKYRDKQERGLVPARYPDKKNMRGAWQHWPVSVKSGRDMTEAGKYDLPPRDKGHSYVVPYRPALNFYLEARRQGDERR